MVEVLRKDIYTYRGDCLDPGPYRVISSGQGCAVDGWVPEIELINVEGINHIKIVREGRKIFAHLSFLAVDISHGDVVYFSRNSFRVVLSKTANSNTLLVTERCNNLCDFCSQPPKDVDDEVLFGMAALSLLAFDSAGVVGISGGEPTLNKGRFLSFLQVLKKNKIKNDLHVLTNGRQFSDANFVKEVSESFERGRISFGIPLYSSIPSVHDNLVGSKGAWKETVLGVQACLSLGVSVELRFIPVAENYSEIVEFISFVGRVFSSVGQVSIMNLEPKGWARNNWNKLYISPSSYEGALGKIPHLADLYGINIKLFNYPLCHLNEEVRSLAVKSISDWKNMYKNECEGCSLKPSCGGFFSSAGDNFIKTVEVL